MDKKITFLKKIFSLLIVSLFFFQNNYSLVGFAHHQLDESEISSGSIFLGHKNCQNKIDGESPFRISKEKSKSNDFKGHITDCVFICCNNIIAFLTIESFLFKNELLENILFFGLDEPRPYIRTLFRPPIFS